MKNATYLMLIAAAGASASCSVMKNQAKPSTDSAAPDAAVDVSNPLMVRSPLQYQAPQFDKIKNAHFRPAFELGLKEQTAEIEKIANNPENPTFGNTVLPLETSGVILTRARTAFGALTGANTNDELQKLSQEYAPVFAAHSDKIYLNSKLYQRIKSVYDNRGSLDAESRRLVENYKQQFEIAGAALSDADKVQLKKINGELATLQTTFSNKLLDARKAGALVVENVKELDGLSNDEIAAAAQNATNAGMPGKYLLALQNTTQQPMLQSLKNRNTRERLFKASWTRAEKSDEKDTRATLEKIAALRLRKAKLLGKPNFAAWKIQDQMAKTPQAAEQLLDKLAGPAVAKAKREAAEIQALIDSQKGGFKLEPWDWNFYAEQVRKAKYDLDENEIKPYFEIQTVLEKGVFYAAEKLFGITFKKRPDLPVYHPDVVAYEVFDKDGSSLALYYLDFYTRDNKNGGAWMNSFVKQSKHLNQKPVIVNVYNFQKPAPGKASLISFDDVTTMFHEFGHSIHGMFADQNYPSLSGTSVPRDFVEFPSQINEHWALEPTVLSNYALHYQTGKPIPQSLVDKIKKARDFNEGYAMTELLAAATLDMAWHTITDESQIKPANEFENEALEKHGLLLKEVPTRYHSPYFAHIWGGGYSAGYYAYIWSEMLDFDAYDWFVQNGGMTRQNGDRFRKEILSVGNSKDLNQAFKDFTGHEPTVEPLMKGRGLIK
ncbi:MAG: peptidyl-dipeptidase Dcp [Chryseobacterium sp.]|nr:MAG: peptidyl-dipeptidase Dcp [Chryseobacterium sp.]